MSDKLLPVIIFITIYAKSSYSLPNRDKNNFTLRNVNSYNTLWRSSVDRLQSNNSHKKIGQNNVTIPLWANLASVVKNYNVVNNISDNNASQYSQGRSVKPRGLVDGFLNFITGGFLYSFMKEEKKDKRRRTKRIKKPSFDDDYDFDPIGSFIDGLENMFDSKDTKRPVEYADNHYGASKITAQTESYEDVSESDYSTEYSQEDMPTEYSPDEQDSDTSSDQDYDDSTSYEDITTDRPYLGTSTYTTPKTVTSIKHRISSYGTTYSDYPQTTWQSSTVTTTTKRKPTKLRKASTTTTTTPKPTRRVETTRPTTRRTTPKTTRTTTTKPPPRRKIIKKPHPANSYSQIYKRPEYKLYIKQQPVVEKQNCNYTSTPVVTPQPWLPTFFNPNNLWSGGDKDTPVTPDPSSTTTKPPGGWLDIFGDDKEDDDPEEQAQKPGTGNWFSNIFGDETSTTSTTTTTTSIPTTTVSVTNPPQASWFNALVNAEEDDGAYTQVVNGSHKIKKGFKRSYEGYQLLRIITKGIGGMKNLLTMQEELDNPGLTWWSLPSLKRPADLLLSPDIVQEVKDHLDADDIKYQILIQDLQKAISFENPKLSKTQRLELERQRGHPLTWKRYHRYADILRYLEFLSLKYPQYVTLIPLGRSSEGLPLVVVKVSYSEQNATRKTNYDNPIYSRWKLKSSRPAIWIDAGMHAREWIAPAVATWFLHALVEGERGEGTDVDVLKLADWYILPVANPDGYEYTHTKDRLWSKTRSKHPPNENSLQSWLPWNWVDPDCVGVDPNRNWDYHWSEKGASDNPCSENYAGPYAFSEPETRVVSTFLMENRDKIKLYLTLQSYSQMWLLPMTHTGVTFSDEIDVMEMGKLALRVLADTSGTKYDIGTTQDVLQPLSGTSYDWAKGIAGIKYSYGVKLRDAKGPHGFLLPGSEIIPTGREIWEAIKAMAYNLN